MAMLCLEGWQLKVSESLQIVNVQVVVLSWFQLTESALALLFDLCSHSNSVSFLSAHH